MTLFPAATRLALAGLMGVLAATPLHAQTQQANPNAAPAGAFNPDLKPHAPKLTVTPRAEIPLGNLRVPSGFRVELWASGMPGARMMTRGDKGTIFVGTRAIGRVYAVTEANGRRSHRVIAEKLTQPNGLAFRNGSLYVAAINKVLRYDRIETNLAQPRAPVDLTQAFDLPADAHHGWKFLAFGPDNKLYVPVGAPCNICEVDENRHALIARFNQDGTGREIVARGVRNSVGFDFHPVTKQLWFTNNGRDWVAEDTPADTLHVAQPIGGHHGFPYCSAGDFQDPDIKGRECTEFLAPTLKLGAHVAALGARFYRGTAFPPPFQNALFIAKRGSWNKTEKSGYEVTAVLGTGQGERPIEVPFLTGFLDQSKNEFWGRPVDVLVQPDGSLLVSDEQNGAIYRVTYRR